MCYHARELCLVCHDNLQCLVEDCAHRCTSKIDTAEDQPTIEEQVERT
jgi:hypothetical protein